MMSGLVAYGSSDEEDSPQQISQSPRTEKAAKDITESLKPFKGSSRGTKTNGHSIFPKQSSIEPDAPIIGPTLGPSKPSDSYVPSPPAVGESSAPQSPYSANRARLRELTVPRMPNLDIPDSPSGSPSASTNAKFAHFLQLKKQGVHFNEKLAKSSALRNPSMMEKLMDFAEIDETGQYSTTLAKEVWNPEAFPEWAYKDELAKSQQNILKKRDDEKAKGGRDSLDFIPSTASGDSSRSGTPGTATGVRPGPKSAAERIMAGLDRGRSTSPSVHTSMKRKTRFEI